MTEEGIKRLLILTPTFAGAMEGKGGMIITEAQLTQLQESCPSAGKILVDMYFVQNNRGNIPCEKYEDMRFAFHRKVEQLLCISTRQDNSRIIFLFIFLDLFTASSYKKASQRKPFRKRSFRERKKKLLKRIAAGTVLHSFLKVFLPISSQS